MNWNKEILDLMLMFKVQYYLTIFWKKNNILLLKINFRKIIPLWHRLLKLKLFFYDNNTRILESPCISSSYLNLIANLWSYLKNYLKNYDEKKKNILKRIFGIIN
jgi:hypothetical protein